MIECDARVRPVSRLRGLQASGLAKGQPVREGGVAWPGHELSPWRDHHSEAFRDRRQRLLQIAVQRPPELVAVVVDHPVGAELMGPTANLRASLGPGLVDRAREMLQLHEARALVTLEDRDGAVGGSVVCDDEEVHPLGAVVVQVGLDDVRYVSDEESHRQAHEGGG